MSMISILARILVIGSLVLMSEYVFATIIGEPLIPFWDHWFVMYPLLIIMGAIFSYMWISIIIVSMPAVKKTKGMF